MAVNKILGNDFNETYDRKYLNKAKHASKDCTKSVSWFICCAIQQYIFTTEFLFMRCTSVELLLLMTTIRTYNVFSIQSSQKACKNVLEPPFYRTIRVIKLLSVQKDIEHADCTFVAVSKNFREKWGKNGCKINTRDLGQVYFLHLVCNHVLSDHFSKYFYNQCNSKSGVWGSNQLNYFGNCISTVQQKFSHSSFQNFLSVIVENCTFLKCPLLSYAIPVLKVRD